MYSLSVLQVCRVLWLICFVQTPVCIFVSILLNKPLLKLIILTGPAVYAECTEACWMNRVHVYIQCSHHTETFFKNDISCSVVSLWTHTRWYINCMVCWECWRLTAPCSSVIVPLGGAVTHKTPARHSPQGTRDAGEISEHHIVIFR